MSPTVKKCLFYAAIFFGVAVYVFAVENSHSRYELEGPCSYCSTPNPAYPAIVVNYDYFAAKIYGPGLILFFPLSLFFYLAITIYQGMRRDYKLIGATFLTVCLIFAVYLIAYDIRGEGNRVSGFLCLMSYACHLLLFASIAKNYKKFPVKAPVIVAGILWLLLLAVSVLFPLENFIWGPRCIYLC
jgi:hypothetical protein